MHGFEASVPQNWVLEPRFSTRTDLRNSRRDEVVGSMRDISPKDHSFLTKIRKDREDLRVKQGMNASPQDFVKKTVSFQYLQKPTYTSFSELVQDRKRSEIIRKDNRLGIKLMDDIAVSRRAMQHEDTSFGDLNQIERQIKDSIRTSRSQSKKNYVGKIYFPVIEENSEKNNVISRTPSPVRINERSASSNPHYKLFNLSLKPNEISHDKYEYHSKHGKATHLYLPNNFLNDIPTTILPSLKEKSESTEKMNHRFLTGHLMKKLQGSRNLKKLIISSPFQSNYSIKS